MLKGKAVLPRRFKKAKEAASMSIVFPAPVRARSAGGPKGPRDIITFDVQVRAYHFVFQPIRKDDGFYDLCVVKMPKCQDERKKFDSIAKNTFTRGDSEFVWIEDAKLDCMESVRR